MKDKEENLKNLEKNINVLFIMYSNENGEIDIENLERDFCHKQVEVLRQMFDYFQNIEE